MSVKSSDRKRISFVELLAIIPAAAELLIEHLLANGCLATARLACKPLRDFIDFHVKTVGACIDESFLRRWRSGDRLKLARWPNCTGLKIRVHLNSVVFIEEEDTRVHMDLVALPLAGLSLAERQRISHLQIEHSWKLYGLSATSSCLVTATISSVVALLPNLRCLDLTQAHGMSYTPLRLQLLYDCLAALPHLEELVLPSPLALDRIGTLAAAAAAARPGAGAGAAACGGLKRLVLSFDNDLIKREPLPGNDSDDEEDEVGAPRDRPLGLSALGQVSQLTGLTHLTLQKPRLTGQHSVDLGGLLNQLWPALAELRLDSVNPDFKTGNVALRYSAGRVTSLTASDALSVEVLAHLATLLHTSALECVELEDVGVWSRYQPLEPDAPALQPLRTLLGRAKRVVPGRLWMQNVRAVSPAVALLGVPRVLRFGCVRDVALELNLWRRLPAPPPGTSQATEGQSSLPFPGRGGAGADAGAGVVERPAASSSSPKEEVELPVLLPSVDKLAQHAMRRLAGASGERVTGAAGGVVGPQAPRGNSNGLLLLRGSFTGTLIPRGVMRWVEDALDAASVEYTIHKYFTVLPPNKEAVVLSYNGQPTTAEVAVALRSAAAGRPTSELEVVVVAASGPQASVRSSQVYNRWRAAEIFMGGAEEVLQGVWDDLQNSGGGGLAAPRVEQEALRRIVELAGQLGKQVRVYNGYSY